MAGEFMRLVSFSCTVKLHYSANFRPPIQHSCRLSLTQQADDSSVYLVLDGKGLGNKSLKVSK